MVTAAWLDEMNDWMVLDGQNGGFWHDGDLRPLAVAELVRRCRAGELRPHFTEPDATPVPEAETWWLYLAHANPEEGTPVAGTFTPGFQGLAYLSKRLTRHSAALWPDLSALRMAVGTGTDEQVGRPVLKFESLHPYAQGVLAEGEPVPQEGLGLPTEPGEYRWSVQVLGPFGTLRSHALHFQINRKMPES